MLKNLPIICFCLLAISDVYGQSVFSGRVLESKTRIALRAIRVENLNNKRLTITDDKGQFSIAAKVGDLLVLTGFAYQPDTLLITDMHDREVFLAPKINLLNQVTITDTSGRAKANANAVQLYDPQFHGQAVVYKRDENLNYTGGIAIRLHYWTKDEHKKRKAQQSAKEREISEHISAVFSPLNISRYVPLKGLDMDNFLLLYTPDVKEYTDKRFELLPYLNACYQNWLTLSEDQRKAGNIFGK
ncbi:MAG: hypothetical protein ACXVJD_13485 [Mucilaginibacter sp.]